MTRKEPPAQAANIKRAVGSTATCTSATVDSLKSVLLLEKPPVDPQTKYVTNARRTRILPPAAQTTKIPCNRPRKRPEVAILQVPEAKVDIMLPQERFDLAAEVVNVTIKALTDAIKRPPPKLAQKLKPCLPKSSSNNLLSNSSENGDHLPLQSLCINRISGIPERSRSLRRSSSDISSKETSGITAQAECARIAFATLRSMTAQKSYGLGMPYLQLENGMSALIGKLIALGLDDLAVKELRILKERLNVHAISASEGNAGPLSSRSLLLDEEPSAKKETLSGLLKFENVNASGPLLALLVSSQLHSLKLIASKANPKVTEAALAHLQLSVPYSPGNLIQAQIDRKIPTTQATAAHQLASLSQLLLSLCPSISSSDDEKLSNPQSISPSVALQYQLLALEVRSRWWKLAGHQGDMVKEILEPFARCVICFHRRSIAGRDTKYDIVKAAFQSLCNHIHVATSSDNPTLDQPLTTLYQILADLAQDSSNYDEALDWVKKSSELLAKNGASKARMCTLSCRIATLQIRVYGRHSPGHCQEDALVLTLKEAVGDLEGDLPGDSTDLDELLVAVASLRKTVFSVLHDIHVSPKPERISWPTETVNQCSKILMVGIRFLIRYIGKEPGHGSSAKVGLRHLQRLRLATEISNPFIESVVALARYCVASSAEDWERIDRGLQDCLKLALSLENPESNTMPETPKSDRKSGVFVSLSNAYWYRYLHAKKTTMDAKKLMANLRMSIDFVKDRPIAEKIAAIVPIKLEKLGLLHESSRDFNRASDAYAEALHLQVDTGCLRIAAQAAATRPVPLVFDSDSNQALFGRLLLAYARITTKIGDEVPHSSLVFDNSTLSRNERGVLLEQQLGAVVSILRLQGASARLCMVVQGLISSILAVYTRAEFPIRRFRVANQCFQLQSVYPTLLDCELLDRLSKEQIVPPEIQSLGFDVGLEGFIPHLIASREISFVFQEGIPNFKTIDTRLAEWTRLIHDCSTWTLLQTRVTDMYDWLNQLELLAEYLELQCIDLTRLSVLHILVGLREAETSTSCCTLVLKLSALGLQYVRLGYPGKAGPVLQKAQKYIDTGVVPSVARMDWHLAYAEYALETGNFAKSEQHLSEAQEQFRAEQNDKSAQRTTTTERSRMIQMLADVAQVQSSLAAAKGQLPKALLLSRKGVKLNRRAWATIERSFSKAPVSNFMKPSDNPTDTLADSISALSISKSQAVPTTYAALEGVFFWPLVPRLFRGLHQLSQIYAHQGLFPEARYYCEQGQKIAEAVNAESLKGQSLAQLGNYFVRSGSREQGVKLLGQAQQTTSSLRPDRHFAILQLHLASMHPLQERERLGESAVVLCEQTLDTLMSAKYVDSHIHQEAVDESFNAQMNELTLQDNGPTRRPRTKRRLPARRSGSKPVAEAKSADPANKSGIASEISTLSRLKGDMLRQRAFAAMCGRSPESALPLLLEAALHLGLAQDYVSHEVIAARLYLRQGLELMVGDPVFGVLPESTVSHPSTRSLGDRFERSPQQVNNITPPRKQPSKAPVRKPRRSRSPLPADYIESLHHAQDGINKICTLATAIGTTTNIHSMADIMAKTLTMISAITSSEPCNGTSSTFVVYMTELGRIVAMMRESLAIRVERQLAITQDVDDWPKGDDSAAPQSLSISKSLEFSSFQKEYIDIIPASWNVISLSLSESRGEIRISKIRAGQSPFILILPLNRHNSRDADEEIFGFNQAKTELQDIIALANYSTHDAQDMSRKGAKSEWWEARAALDARLKDLLVNIESIWLGGFRGVFTQKIHTPDLLSRLQQSLHNILDRHLPSRQKLHKGHKSNRMVFDSRVLELFVEMGDPEDVDDLDEPLMDLLYFVIDILQFNGERNAYDEIDFDSIAIETLDALRHYHQASKAIPHDDRNQHTILILDKALHCFPWESLSCMNGDAVSRLPSLGCLRDRILQQQQQQQKGGARSANEGWQVDRDSGAYVLNPAGDLPATQTKFEQPLQDMLGWESTVGREPTEDDMKAYLETRGLFLYFGHGSGSQYIRSRTIKQLDSCSVALLMGCSSGALTEAGEFEPYGTPINYMHAGCPALLATLWDVTDKDIDRFSYTVLEKWGLFREHQKGASSSPVKRGAKQRGKSKAVIVKSTESELLSLDQAVAQGRDSCILKYLNGAAPVVYGIPAFLS